MSAKEKIHQIVTENTVVLFMKGTPTFPQCGFSSAAAQILKNCGAKFAAVNVLADAEVREAVKEYANWPTIPQLYISGEFVGGSDIMKELYATGELKKMLDDIAS